MAERVKKGSSRDSPTFSNCCNNGIVQVPPERDFPIYLHELLAHPGSKARQFRKNILSYNNSKSMAFLTENWIESGPGVSHYNLAITIQGRIYQRIGA